MYSFRSVFLSVSAVSALVLVPNVSPIAPSTISLNNVSTIPETVHGPWNVSTVLESPLDPPNLTHSSTSSLTRQIKVKCTQILGQGPYTASCEDAVRHMAFIPSGFDESQELRWGMRDSIAAKDVGLPQEVVSSDGHCAINLHLPAERGTSVARASQWQVKAGVSAVVESCMKNKARPQGGAAHELSDDGLLAAWVWIRPRREDFVTCYGRMRANVEASCKWILDRMEANSDDGQLFGPQSDPDADVNVPWRLESPDHRCALTLRTAGPSDVSSWGILWDAAVQLAGVCARRGMQGRQVQLGEGRHLALFFTDPSTDDTNVS